MCCGCGAVGIEARIDLVVGGIRQSRPILILAQQRNAEIAAHHERLAVRRQSHQGVVDVAVARIEDGAVLVGHTVALHAADDVEAEPRLVVAVVLALIADDRRVLSPGFRYIRTIIPSKIAVMVAEQKPAGRLAGVRIDCLPKSGGRQFDAACVTGGDRPTSARPQPIMYLARISASPGTSIVRILIKSVKPFAIEAIL